MSRPLAAVLMLLWCSPVLARGPAGPYKPPTAPTLADRRDSMSHDLDYVMASAHEISWKRAETRPVDWLARRDPGYRTIFRRYGFQETADGWHWFRGDLTASIDVRALNAARLKGETIVDLDVHRGGVGPDPWASLVLSGPLRAGSVRFDWSPPPERLCMSDGVHLQAHAVVTDGEPGAQKIMFVLPLDREQLAVKGPEVKACSRADTTEVDFEVGVDEDAGRCDREIYHLQPYAPWELWVCLPESFYVVYEYVPAER